jgi:hypothetical protein
MKGVYGKMYKMSRNEGFAVFAITFAVVVAYSAWGSYILHTQNTGGSPQVVTVER